MSDDAIQPPGSETHHVAKGRLARVGWGENPEGEKVLVLELHLLGGQVIPVAVPLSDSRAVLIAIAESLKPAEPEPKLTPVMRPQLVLPQRRPF
jgi:hypothetical protein